jgi:hypothetical protein
MISLIVVQPVIFLPLYGQSSSNTNMSSASPAPITPQDLDTEMKRIVNSSDPVDIATLAYIWGYPLVIEKRFFEFSTNPNVPAGQTRGPVNSFIHARDLINASFTDVVRPNADTLYSAAYLDLKKEPIVIQVPPIPDRYYVLQFMDAYTNNFFYIGTRTNVTSGGSYLITGPNWNGTVSTGMTQIKSRTNLAIILGRTLVNGPQDVSDVRALQDKFILSPLSFFEGVTRSDNPVATTRTASITNATKEELPMSPQPSFIPKTGIKIYDEIGKDMANNPPYQYGADVIAKFKSIGIGPGLTPSSEEAANATIKQALQKGIEQGERLIDEKVRNLGTIVNGWSINLDQVGDYGTDYLLRAAVAKTGLGANSPQEALYPMVSVDDRGEQLTGSRNYVIHFDKDKIPPGDWFWSISMYNSKDYFVDNPINRYAIGDRTPGLKYNTDGSLDIYIQHDNPGKDRESNWLPAPTDDKFSLALRLYIPQEVIFKGQYQFPPVHTVRQ